MSEAEKLIRIEEANGRLAVMIEDDGEVVWAYLLENGEISSDVWMCNHAEGPASFSRRGEGQPPLDISQYDAARTLPELTTESVSAHFARDGADLFLDGEWIAQLRVGVTPGWSLLSLAANAVAKPLTETERLG